MMKASIWSGVATLALLLGACNGGVEEAADSEAGAGPAPGGAVELADAGAEAGGATFEDAAVTGWLNWRGPDQNSTTTEAGLPTEWDPEEGTNHLWTLDYRGRGAPVIADGVLYAIGYVGTRARDVREVIFAADAETGEVLWEHYFSDFLSDIIYDRYSIGSPTIDPETGNVYVLTTPGIVLAFTPEGEELWRVSMMEELGRLTFPNGRTGAPVIDGNRVIIHCISGNWGAHGPGRDRFYAFDKETGDLMWASDPGIGPPFLRDSSFATPYLHTTTEGRRVFYAGTGDGNVVQVDARTGEPVWRFQLAIGGINSSIIRDGERIYAVHGLENLDSSRRGRMVALDVDGEVREPNEDEGSNPILDESAELWRNDDIRTFSSSPILVDDRIYVFDQTGVLNAVDVESGRILWTERLAPSQLHATPLYSTADDIMYVGMPNGDFYILDIQDDGLEVLEHVELEGSIFGSPVAWDGRVYIFTTERFYAFGYEDGNDPENLPERPQFERYEPSDEAVAVRLVPAEVLMIPGSTEEFRVQRLDAMGRVIDEVPSAEASFEKYIPEAALVRSEMDAEFDSDGRLVALEDASVSAGAFRVEYDGLTGYGRGRVVSYPPFSEDFSGYELSEFHEGDEEAFSHPPLPWIGGRFRWDIRERDGENVLAKGLDNILFQRATTFIGHPSSSGYTVQADVMTDGDRRLMSDVGVINQRYIVTLRGNHQHIEVTSNSERLSEFEQYFWEPNEWHTIKTRVDVHDDGSGVVRAKAWPRGSEEPSDWLLEVNVDQVHQQGAPGVYGFSPQVRYRTYIDNIQVMPNEN